MSRKLVKDEKEEWFLLHKNNDCSNMLEVTSSLWNNIMLNVKFLIVACKDLDEIVFK